MEALLSEDVKIIASALKAAIDKDRNLPQKERQRQVFGTITMKMIS